MVKKNKRHANTKENKKGWKDADLRFRLLTALPCSTIIRVSAIKLRHGRTTGCPITRTCASVGLSCSCVVGVWRLLRTHPCDFPSQPASPQPHYCLFTSTRGCTRPPGYCFLYSSSAEVRCTPHCACEGSPSILLRHTSSGSLCGAALSSTLCSFHPAGSARP